MDDYPEYAIHQLVLPDVAERHASNRPRRNKAQSKSYPDPILYKKFDGSSRIRNVLRVGMAIKTETFSTLTNGVE
jgi:hypothetical protein